MDNVTSIVPRLRTVRRLHSQKLRKEQARVLHHMIAREAAQADRIDDIDRLVEKYTPMLGTESFHRIKVWVRMELAGERA